MAAYEDIAADLREQIRSGALVPGQKIPSLAHLAAQFGVNRHTAAQGVNLLVEEGLLQKVRGRNSHTKVRERRSVVIELNRYREALTVDDGRGPWETACHRQGLNGRMVLVDFQPAVPAEDEVARLFGIPPGTLLAYRRRHAMIDSEVHHLQQVWFPRDLVAGTALAENVKVEGGAMRLLAALGHGPHELTEEVTARRPTLEEVKELSIGINVPILSVWSITYDRNGRAIQVLAVTGPGDQMRIVYGRLPYPGRQEEGTGE